MPNWVWPLSLGKHGNCCSLGCCNKCCHACVRGILQEDHACYKNWIVTSSGMETDNIFGGFLEAGMVHGVCYTQFIGDVIVLCTQLTSRMQASNSSSSSSSKQ